MIDNSNLQKFTLIDVSRDFVLDLEFYVIP